MSTGGTPNQIKVPIYVDASSAEAGMRQFLRAAQQEYAHFLGRGQQPATVFTRGVAQNPPITVGQQEQQEALTRRNMFRFQNLQMEAERLQWAGRITAQQLEAFTANLGTTRMTFADLQQSLRVMVHENRRFAANLNAANTRLKNLIIQPGPNQVVVPTNIDRRGFGGGFGNAFGTGLNPNMMMTNAFMGGAGVLTGLAMPTSGFSFLTAGFAAFSGPGFGVAASAAVFSRAIFDGVRALNTFQDSLLESAEAAGAVTDRFKEQREQLAARGVAQGAIASLFQEDTMQNLNESLRRNSAELTNLNAGWAQLRSDFRGIFSNIMNITPGGSRMMLGGFGGALGTILRGFSPGLGGIGNIPGFGTSAERTLRGLFLSASDRATERLRNAGPMIDEMIANLERPAFRSTEVGPAELNRRIQIAALSRLDKQDETNKWLRQILEQLKEDARQAGRNADQARRGRLGLPDWIADFNPGGSWVNDLARALGTRVGNAIFR